LQGIITSIITPSFTFSTLTGGRSPTGGKDFQAAFQIAGAGGNTKFYSPTLTYRQYFPMKGLKVNKEGHNVLGYRVQLSNVAGFGGEVAPPFQRIYGGGETEVRGFDVRSSSPYTFIPTKVLFNLTNPDGTLVPRDPTDSSLGNIQIPLPIYRLVSIGGDTQITANAEYRIPIVSQVTFAFFTDFGMTFTTRDSQLRQSVLGQSAINSPIYGCPQFINGACFGGQHVNFPINLSTVPGTNFVPRMSNGAELQVILPVVNAPFRIYYAYNPLRLFQDAPQQLALPLYKFNDLFPKVDPNCVSTPTATCQLTGAGAFTYQQALQLYGADYILREPRKTFRLTVSTTF
jgi:outer membrane protein insertion porin family